MAPNSEIVQLPFDEEEEPLFYYLDFTNEFAIPYQDRFLRFRREAMARILARKRASMTHPISRSTRTPERGPKKTLDDPR